MKMVNDFPRRARVDLMSPAEKAILDAMAAVEKEGADLRMTDAICHLQRAKDAVADYVDSLNSHLPDAQ